MLGPRRMVDGWFSITFSSKLLSAQHKFMRMACVCSAFSEIQLSINKVLPSKTMSTHVCIFSLAL